VRVVPLSPHSPRAIRAALAARGWQEGEAATIAEGAAPAAFRIEGLSDESLEALVHFSGPLGIDVVSGDGWALLLGSRARLSALARPWTVPEALRDVAEALGLAIPPEAPRAWRTTRGDFPVAAPVIMGILNVTPDSFSDGGARSGVPESVERAASLIRDGAGIIDVGGESTRPGRTETVPVEEELRRTIPVIAALTREFPGVAVSIDTTKAAVAEKALEAGASIVNDVSGLRHGTSMASLVATSGAGVVIMHSRGGPLELASLQHASYGADLMGELLAELGAAIDGATRAGVAPEQIVVDPGFGFAKTADQNMFVADQLSALRSLGRPILVGPSRKRFLGAVTGRSVGERDAATAAACALAWERGARLFRVHDVASTRDALAVANAFGGTTSTS